MANTDLYSLSCDQVSKVTECTSQTLPALFRIRLEPKMTRGSVSESVITLNDSLPKRVKY